MRKSGEADRVDPQARPLGDGRVDEIDPHMPVLAQGVGGAEEHEGAEQVPLDFQEPVRAVAEEVADDGVAGADQAGGEDQPLGDEPGQPADPVDGAAGDEKRRPGRGRAAVSVAHGCHGCVLRGCRARSATAAGRTSAPAQRGCSDGRAIQRDRQAAMQASSMR